MGKEIYDYGIKSASDVSDGASNTRPPNTQKSTLRVLVDWVSIAFDLPVGYDEVFEFIGLGKIEYETYNWGTNTYDNHARFSNIVLQRKNDYQYQLNLTGQGCREFENYSTLDWFQLFAILKDFCNGKATRIDIAVDDFKSYYNVNMIRNTFLDNRCRTRMRSAKDTKEYNTGDLSVTMDSFYLGSMSSRLSINFYDKKLERESKNYEVTEKEWTRTELRCKRDYADMVIDLLLIHDQIGNVVLGILKQHVSFIQKSDLKNKSRVPVIKWWSDFLKQVEPIQLSLKAPDKTIEKTKNWISKSVAPAMAMLKEADPLMFESFMIESLEQGAERLNDKHYRMIDQYNDDKYKKAKSNIRELNNEINENNISNVNERILNRLNKKNARNPRE